MTKFKPTTWEQLPHGDVVKETIEQQLACSLSQAFGYHLLKLGPLSAAMNTHTSSIDHQFSLSETPLAHVLADYTHLPIANHSIDCVLANLLLEFETNPFKVLREINRVMIAGGHLIIVGCNPISSLAIGKFLPRKRHGFPWSGRFFSPERVRDWLEVLGFQVIEQKRIIYHSLLGNYADNTFLQSWMHSWLPFMGSFYVINARKIECPLTPSHIWKKKRAPNWSTAPIAGRTLKANKKYLIRNE
ncbi:MAG: class I SAM-dependent methyltransferase [Parashewanella sp.]